MGAQSSLSFIEKKPKKKGPKIDYDKLRRKVTNGTIETTKLPPGEAPFEPGGKISKMVDSTGRVRSLRPSEDSDSPETGQLINTCQFSQQFQNFQCTEGVE